MARRSRVLSAFLRLLLGMALVGALAWLVILSATPKDWAAIARDRFETGKDVDAIAAIDRAMRDPVEAANDALWYLRARANANLALHANAIADVRRALELNPRYIPYLTFEINLLALRGDWDEGIVAADKGAALYPGQDPLAVPSATIRLGSVSALEDRLAALLAANHPAPFRAREMIAAFLAAPALDGPDRRRILDPLPEGQVKSDAAADLDQAWTRLHDADAILGDTRSQREFNQRGSLARAEIDIKLGRLLRAKEEMQLLLTLALPPAIRREALALLARALHRAGAPAAEAAYLQMIVEMDSDDAGNAPVFRVADMLEALFFAAEKDAKLRVEFLRRADLHLRTHRNEDMRSLGYRGIAALTWEKKPDAAIDDLYPVYEALRYKRDKDPSVLEPERVQRFVLALLDAYAAADQTERGLAIANSLIEVSIQDPQLRRRRASILGALGRSGEAANDLLVALHYSPRDPKLFEEWLSAASNRKDANGNTPRQLAREAIENARRKKQDLFDRARPTAGPGARNAAARAAPRLVHEISNLLGPEIGLASDPIIAWLLADECGKIGAIEDAQTFIFKAVQAEPLVKQFRFREAQYSLDEGRFASAAAEFQTIFESDPEDTGAAYFAALANELNGNLEEARRIRRDAILADPARAGLLFPVLSSLAIGEPQRAFALLQPYSNSPDAEIQALFGRTYLALGSPDLAIAALEKSRAATQDAPAHLRDLMLAYAAKGDAEKFTATADAFAALPNLLPLVEIDRVLDRLEKDGRHAESAHLAKAVAGRYSERHNLELAGRAARQLLLAGSPDDLRALRDTFDVASRLDDATVLAAFGLTFREAGARAAAEFLNHAREYQSNGASFALPTAVAYALTPFVSETASSLRRFERSLGDGPIPLDDQLAWWLVRLRLPRDDSTVDAAPPMEPGAEGELLFYRERDADEPATGESLRELTLRFLALRAAGPGFEDDAEALARTIVERDARAGTAARFVAERIRARDGAAAAEAYLVPAFDAAPGDRRTFEALGALLMEGDPASPVLGRVAHEGRGRFPNLLLPYLLQARSLAGQGAGELAQSVLQDAMARWPFQADLLRARAELARDTKDDATLVQVASAVAERGLDDPELRALILERYGRGAQSPPEALPILSRMVQADPKFYEGAEQLALLLVIAGSDPPLAELAHHLTAVIPADPSAAHHGDDLAQITRLLRTRGLDADALALANAALLADPSSIALRQVRVDLLMKNSPPGSALSDLRLLCFLAPTDPTMLLNYGSELLEASADESDLVAGLLPLLGRVAAKDPRFHTLQAKLLFRNDRIGPAIDQVFQAIQAGADPQENMYFLGILSVLDGRIEIARKALANVPTAHPGHARAQYLLKLLPPG